MSLVAGDVGSKTILPDGAQVDHLSENTVGHGARVKGVSDPTTYPVLAGDVGETFSSAVQGVGFGASVTWYNAVSLTLAPGKWSLSGNGYLNLAGATMTNEQIAISAYSGGTTTDHVIGDNNQSFPPPTATYGSGGSVVSWIVNPTITTTYYFKVWANYTGGAPTYSMRMTATRIA
jgi:hypothetical protein